MIWFIWLAKGLILKPFANKPIISLPIINKIILIYIGKNRVRISKFKLYIISDLKILINNIKKVLALRNKI